jgi:phosphosulfolactate synthase
VTIAQGRVDGLVAYLHEHGLEHVEISDGTISIEHADKLRLIERLAADFTVLSEVGSKDDTVITPPYRWVEQIRAELESGAWRVILEGRESGTAGIFRADGEVRMGLIDEIAHAVDFHRLLFDAPRKDQQVWFLRRFGSEVNLGNIHPDDVLSLETLRLGLRADTALTLPRPDRQDSEGGEPTL